MTTTTSTTTSTTISPATSPQYVAGLIVAATGAAALAGAWFFQLVVGLAPCPLCLEQRVPYYIGVPLALVAVFLAAKGRVGFSRAMLGLVFILMAIGAGLAIYHSGVEWRLWEGPTACSGGGPVTSTNMLMELQQARVVRCDEAPWRLVGVSLAGWNALIASALTLVAFVGAIRR